MKKFFVVIVSLILILVLVQGAFAKNNVGLTLGYNDMQFGHYDDNTQESTRLIEKGFVIGLSADAYLINRLSLAGEINISINSQYGYEDDWFDHNAKDEYASLWRCTRLILHLFLKYEVFRVEIANVGVQAGFMSNSEFWKLYKKTENKWIDNGNELMTFFALGAYGEVNIMPKLNGYADLKFPIMFWEEELIRSNGKTSNVGFFKHFFYDITLGLTYEIFRDISLGLQGNVKNTTDHGFYYYQNKEIGNVKDENKFFNFSVSAKLVYSF